MYRKVHMSEFGELNNRHATLDMQQHHTPHDTEATLTTVVCNKQYSNDTLYHERNTTPLPSVCLMQVTRQTGNMPRPMHSVPCCGALPLPLPLRCEVVVIVVLWLSGFVVVV